MALGLLSGSLDRLELSLPLRLMGAATTSMTGSSDGATGSPRRAKTRLNIMATVTMTRNKVTARDRKEKRKGLRDRRMARR